MQAAAAAFAEGQRAQLRGDFPRAAELFEIADQAAPSPAALRSAIRNREASGQDVRAAMLSLRAIERYGEDRETRSLAESTLSRLQPHLTRVRVQCGEPCALTVDGGLVGQRSAVTLEFFVSPGPHTLEARWAGRDPLTRGFEGSAGQELAVELKPTAPSAPPAASPLAPAPAAAVPPSPPAAAPLAPLAPAPENTPPVADTGTHGHGLPPTVFWVGAGLTVASGALLTWSGLNTLSARDRYVKNPTRDGFDDGKSRETRTNVLAVTTALLGAGTIVVGLFATDWGVKSVGLGADRDRVALNVSGTLP